MGQMIVTCDHCGTRYKLDESKIPGRGARVTCPSCKHVFVVYRKPAGAAEEVAASSPPKPAAPPKPSIEDEINGLDPDNLDFRSVGISSWKVKVKIGLVYDFNDFKTIDKYIREGRVSGSDLLSHDGESWRPIEEIADLRRHFCEVFVRARRALEDVDDEDDDFSEDEPTRIMQASPAIGAGPKKLGAPKVAAAPKSVATARAATPTTPTTSISGGGLDLASAIADATADVDAQSGASSQGNSKQPTGPRFVDPFEAKRAAAKANKSGDGARKPKPRPRNTKKTPPPSEGGGVGRLVLIGAVMVAVVLGGLYYTTLNQGSNAAEATPPPANTRTRPAEKPDANPNSEEADTIRDDLIRELEGLGEPVEEPAQDPNVDEWGNPIEQELIPVVPEEFREPQDDGLNGGTMSVADKTPSEHAADGAAAKRRGDWKSAVGSYQRAASMDPGNAGYQMGLGEALARSGQTNQAISTLKRASSMGATQAERLLGDIYYDKLGDDSSAIRHYEAYLSKNPSDAQVKNRIAAIRGG